MVRICIIFSNILLDSFDIYCVKQCVRNSNKPAQVVIINLKLCVLLLLGAIVVAVLVSYVIPDLLRMTAFNFFIQHQLIFFNLTTAKPAVNVYFACVVLKNTRLRNSPRISTFQARFWWRRQMLHKSFICYAKKAASKRVYNLDGLISLPWPLWIT